MKYALSIWGFMTLPPETDSGSPVLRLRRLPRFVRARVPLYEQVGTRPAESKSEGLVGDQYLGTTRSPPTLSWKRRPSPAPAPTSVPRS